jgi:16S rRNA (uracil1498-N3)-methyltransferase
MPRIYLPIITPKEQQISITGEKAHYLTSVLRCRKGDELIVFDGYGECFKTIIISIDRKEVIAGIRGTLSWNPESPVDIILVQSLLKSDRMDLVIRKTTELGVKEIIPVITERTQMRETRKVERWRKIAEEASRQSGRSIIPAVHEPVELKQFLSTCDSGFTPLGVIFYEEEGIKLSEAVSTFNFQPSTFFVIIGPEGGFAGEEIDLAKDRGILVASLGKRILRSETAAISAVTLVQFLFGDLG